jgi:hypothetical protein
VRFDPRHKVEEVIRKRQLDTDASSFDAACLDQPAIHFDATLTLPESRLQTFLARPDASLLMSCLRRNPHRESRLASPPTRDKP